MSFREGDYEYREGRKTGERSEEAFEAACEARAAEILADNNELTNAAAEDPAIERALCEIARICMNKRERWIGHWCRDIGEFVSVPPPEFLANTTALRAAISEYARRKLEGKE